MPIKTRSWAGTADAARWPLTVACSAVGCTFTVCASTVHDAEFILQDHESNGPCPYGAREAQKSMPVGKSLRERQWDRLDEAVRQSMALGATEIQKATKNGMAMGLAYSIFEMDTPYWASIEAVLQEAAKRYRIYIGAEEFSPTPGYDYPHNVQMLDARNKAAQAASSQAKPETRHPLDIQIAQLDKKKLTGIIRGLSVDFPKEQLAEMYGVPLPMVKRIAAQPDRFAQTAG